MPISLTIEANDLAELQALSKKFLNDLLNTTAVPVAVPAEVLPLVAAAEPARRGRKPKADGAKEPVQTDTEDAVKTTEAVIGEPPVEVTKDDVINELQQVNSKFGMAVVRELLQPFGAEAIKQLKPEQYADVVAAAKAKLAA